jgi:Fic family protein
MRIPQAPPKLDADPCRNADVLRIAQDLSESKGYLHWEELRRLRMPEGIGAEEVWRALKQFRVPYVNIPFHEGGKPFHYVNTPSIQQHLHILDRSTSTGLVKLPRDVLTEERRASYIIRSLVEESITSSQLEGAATTREVAREMIRQRRPPRDKNERMIFNNFVTMESLRKSPPRTMDREAVFDIHRRVCFDTLDKPDAAGRFRKADEPVRVESEDGAILHIPPASGELEARMDNMCRFANDNSGPFIHPVIKAIILHFWLAYDHPFVDGNGRTARALFYWYMLRAGYDIFEFISISQILNKAPVKYGQAFLYTESDDNDLTYFIEHQLSVIEAAVEALGQYVDRQMQYQRQLRDLMRAQMCFNHRQQDLLTHAFRHPGYTYTIRGHQNSHGVSAMTARNDLTELEKEGLILKEKVGKTFVFIVPSDVVERLRKYRN